MFKKGRSAQLCHRWEVYDLLHFITWRSLISAKMILAWCVKDGSQIRMEGEKLEIANIDSVFWKV